MTNSKFIKILITLIILSALGLFIYVSLTKNQPKPDQSATPIKSSTTKELIVDSANRATTSSTQILPPIDSALQRVTKKSFGIYITPKNSPVSPERFTGYHTGVDFEILAGEENKDILIFAVCDGTLLLKQTVSGYGGVAVQSCRLDSQAVTIIYGHLKLTGVNIKTGDKISAGEKIGILGKGYSTETSGERKHLHLGIHQGSNINLRGYVQSSKELNQWFDITKFLK